MEESNRTYKVLILGESGVGKSWFTEDVFNSEGKPTIGCDFKKKKLRVDDVEVDLAIWDTAGQERFQSLTPMFYREAHCAILVYDVTNKASFLKLNTWVDIVRSNSENAILMVVGNKSDLEELRQVTEKEGMNFAKSINSLFMETSAKNSIGVSETFTELVRKVIQTPILNQPRHDVVSLRTPSDETKEGNSYSQVSVTSEYCRALEKQVFEDFGDPENHFTSVWWSSE